MLARSSYCSAARIRRSKEMKRRIDGTRRLVSSSSRGLSLGDSSRVTRTAGCKRPLRCWGNQQIRWSTSSAPPVVPEISPSAIARQRQSRTIAALSVVFVTAVLIEGNAKQGWIGKDPPTLPRVYSREVIQNYWKQRPISIVRRLGQVAIQLGPIWARYVGYKYSPFASKRNLHGVDAQLEEQVIRTLAKELKDALTYLGPAWIKAGQQLAIRPDIAHPLLLKELQTLHDSVKLTITHDEALEIVRNELGEDKVNDLKEFELVASASLGQVYKAKLQQGGEKSNQTVAIKIQRPGMLESFSLDLFLLQMYGSTVDTFTSTFTKQPPYHRAFFDSFSHGSYSELDYENEAKNQMLFQHEFATRGLNHKVKIPNVFVDYSTQRVLTTEWIDGIPLAHSPAPIIQKLIPVGVDLFLTQLLDIGTFHSDPHPGNILVTADKGILCLLDFGLCVKVEPEERRSMTKALVHLLYRDFDKLVDQDSKDLGFLPQDFDTEEIKPILIKVLNGGLLEAGSDMKNRKRKFMEISSELNEIFFKYPFQVPPFFALVTRGLGLLEGIALSGDPNFDIFQASLPFVASRRAVSLLLSGANAKQEKVAGMDGIGSQATKPREGLRRKSRKFFSWLVSKAPRNEETES
ncbi:unnamed protein product [Cylindrotheca closterium]|uniref:Protein kinase domain-containing protein n=1 Tax=Cylindrotheca closterium TaxID=2856 RepID=A0AAD2CJL6_9STRA|nr:unnamed protein product [Cylindrotheca closterium]